MRASVVDCVGKNNTSFSQEKAEFPVTNLEQFCCHYYICVIIENILILASSENILILVSSLVRSLYFDKSIYIMPPHTDKITPSSSGLNCVPPQHFMY